MESPIILLKTELNKLHFLSGVRLNSSKRRESKKLIPIYENAIKLLESEGNKEIKSTEPQLKQADVRGQLIAFLRKQTKLHYVMIYENDFDFADKILKAINLP